MVEWGATTSEEFGGTLGNASSEASTDFLCDVVTQRNQSCLFECDGGVPERGRHVPPRRFSKGGVSRGDGAEGSDCWLQCYAATLQSYAAT